MNNFGRALRLALRNRLTVAGIFICSLLVALLWGANIGTIYPVVEVVFQGDSTHKWIDDKIGQAEKNADEFKQQIAKLRKQKAAAEERYKPMFENQIQRCKQRLDAEEKAKASAERMRPYVRRWLPDDPFHTLVVVIVFLLFGAIAKNLALIGNSLLVARLSQSTTLELRRQFFRKLLELDLAVLGKNGIGRLMSRMGDIGGVVGGITILVGRSLQEPLKMVVCLGGAAFISWRLLLFTLVLVPPAFYLMTLLAKSIKRASRRMMEESAEFSSRLSESFSSIAVVKAFTMEQFERTRFHEGCRELYRKAMKMAKYNSLVSPNNELLGFGVIGLGLLSGGYLVVNHETHLLGIKILDRPISVGALMAFYAFLAGVSDPGRKLASVFSQLQNSFAAADRVYDMLDREPQVIDPASPQELADCRREIVFDNVSFHYEENEPVLRNISLRIRQGESLAIVGPNGCGKSTFVNLLLRFYDPVDGAVRLDDTDLRDVRQHDLRKHIGLVTQQTMLFDDTVMSNIRYGSLDASDEEVIEAAKRAHAHKFIEGVLEKGYETHVGHSGNRLSGGQRQRIALARAILRDPDILILDEATSQIDPESEQAIHQALQEFIQGRTAIMITHRMSTLELADRILVMNEGRIVDIGTHDELVLRCEIYRRLRQTSDLRKSA